MARFISLEKYIDTWQSVIRSEWRGDVGNFPSLQEKSLFLGF